MPLSAQKVLALECFIKMFRWDGYYYGLYTALIWVLKTLEE